MGIKYSSTKFREISMAIIVPKLLWISKKLELTFILGKYIQNQAKSVGLSENRKFRFSKPRRSGF